MKHWLQKILQLRAHKDKTTELAFIYQSLTEEIYEQYNPPVKYFQTKRNKGKINYHAEMKLLGKLWKEGLLNDCLFLAISKKCCLKRAAAIQALNLYLKAREGVALNSILAKESHFTLYNMNWHVPNFILEDSVVLQNFMGIEAYELYCNNINHKDKFIKDLKYFCKYPPQTKSRKNTNHTLTKSDSRSNFVKKSSKKPKKETL